MTPVQELARFEKALVDEIWRLSDLRRLYPSQRREYSQQIQELMSLHTDVRKAKELFDTP